MRPAVRARGVSVVFVLLAAAVAACRPAASTRDAHQVGISSPAAPAPAPASPPAVAAEEPPSEEGIKEALAPKTNDLDGMIERRSVRMLVRRSFA